MFYVAFFYETYEKVVPVSSDTVDEVIEKFSSPDDFKCHKVLVDKLYLESREKWFKASIEKIQSQVEDFSNAMFAIKAIIPEDLNTSNSKDEE